MFLLFPLSNQGVCDWGLGVSHRDTYFGEAIGGSPDISKGSQGVRVGGDSFIHATNIIERHLYVRHHPTRVPGARGSEQAKSSGSFLSREDRNELENKHM